MKFIERLNSIKFYYNRIFSNNKKKGLNTQTPVKLSIWKSSF